MQKEYYDLPQEIKNQKLNELFPKFIYKLSITNKQILLHFAKEIKKNQQLKFIRSILSEIRKKSVELLKNPAVQEFLKIQMNEIKSKELIGPQ